VSLEKSHEDLSVTFWLHLLTDSLTDKPVNKETDRGKAWCVMTPLNCLLIHQILLNIQSCMSHSQKLNDTFMVRHTFKCIQVTLCHVTLTEVKRHVHGSTHIQVHSWFKWHCVSKNVPGLTGYNFNLHIQHFLQFLACVIIFSKIGYRYNFLNYLACT